MWTTLDVMRIMAFSERSRGVKLECVGCGTTRLGRDFVGTDGSCPKCGGDKWKLPDGNFTRMKPAEL